MVSKDETLAYLHYLILTHYIWMTAKGIFRTYPSYKWRPQRVVLFLPIHKIDEFPMKSLIFELFLQQLFWRELFAPNQIFRINEFILHRNCLILSS